MKLSKAMRVLDAHEPWTIGTENGNGWLFYFDGETIHDGAHGETLAELLDRKCVECYEREGREYWSDEDRKYFNYMELKEGLAFIVVGRENGSI